MQICRYHHTKNGYNFQFDNYHQMIENARRVPLFLTFGVVMSTTFLKRIDRNFLISQMYCDYVFGKCYEFAIALHEGLALPLVGVQVGDEIIHAGVQPDADTYRDVRGDQDMAGFVRGFDVSAGFIVRPTTREELEQLYVQKIRVELSREFVNRARMHAESIWPEWKWKDSKVARVAQFISDLENLCRRHGLWIREQFPANPAIIYFGDEAERGYDIHQLEAAHLQFLITRRFE